MSVKGVGLRSEFHLKRHGLIPTISTITATDEIGAFAEEIRLIAMYGRRDLNTGTLYNLTNGGEGSVGRRLSEETKHKISVANSNPSLERRAKMAAWERTTETKQKIGAKIAKAKRNWSPEMIEQERVRRSIAGLKQKPELKCRNLLKHALHLRVRTAGRLERFPVLDAITLNTVSSLNRRMNRLGVPNVRS